MGQHLHNLATSLIGQLNITSDDLRDPKLESEKFDFGSQILWDKRGEDVKRYLREKMKPETLGRIVAQGGGCDESNARHGNPLGTDLYQVHCGTYLGKYWDGTSLLVQLAATAIVAEMSDILSSRKATEKSAVSTPA